jgi:hypothetical protein
MPKTPGSKHILTDDPTKRRDPPETAVYEPGGTFVMHRVGNDVFRGGERVYYIDQNAVYDEHGVRRFYIADQWWYTTEGKQAYYQHDVIPKDWDKWPEDQAP